MAVTVSFSVALESTGYYPNFGENFPFEFDSNLSTHSAACVAGACTCATNGYTLEKPGCPRSHHGAQASPHFAAAKATYARPIANNSISPSSTASATAWWHPLGYVGAVSRHLQFFPNPNGQTALTPNGFSGYTDRQWR